MKASRQTKLAVSSGILRPILRPQSLVNSVVLPVVALADVSGAAADGEDRGGALPWKDTRQINLSLHRN